MILFYGTKTRKQTAITLKRKDLRQCTGSYESSLFSLILFVHVCEGEVRGYESVSLVT